MATIDYSDTAEAWRKTGATESTNTRKGEYYDGAILR